eukprot:694032-Amphidinium_carterae.1
MSCPPQEEGLVSGSQASSSEVREAPTRVEEHDPRRGAGEVDEEAVGKELVQELRRFGARVGPYIDNLSSGGMGSRDYGGINSLIALEQGATGHDETEYPEDDIAQFYDDVSGKLLPTAGVRKARKEELEFLQSFPFYQKVPEAEAK